MTAFYLVAAIVFFIIGMIWTMKNGLNFFLEATFLGMALWGIACFIIKMSHG